MKILHHLYTALSEDWYAAALAVSIFVAVLIVHRAVSYTVVFVVAVLSLLLTYGWMMLDVTLYPKGHELVPVEALFKLPLLFPVVVGVIVKLYRAPVGPVAGFPVVFPAGKEAA